MIKATKLHETFRGDINRINSDYLRALSVVDVDMLLTDTWFTIYENLIAKFETNSVIDDHLRQKLVRNKSFKPTKEKGYVKVKYPNELRTVVRRSAVACADGCEQRILKTHPVQTSDLNESLTSNYWSPSWEWEETLFIQDSDGIILYDDCNFKIKEVLLDYLTKPKPIKCPSLVKDDCYKAMKGQYIDHSNTIVTVDEDFEIDSTDLWLKVAHLAAASALKNVGDLQNYKAIMDTVLTNEKIFL